MRTKHHTALRLSTVRNVGWELRLTLAISVPLTASITPGENCNVTPGSTVSAARAPMMRSSWMRHGLLYASILNDSRKKPPFDMRWHAACALPLVDMTTTASVMATTEHIQFMLIFWHHIKYSLKCHDQHWSQLYSWATCNALQLTWFTEHEPAI